MISDPTVDRLRTLLQDPSEDRYEIRSVLGQGGMGTVYLAHDTALDREVALKVLDPDANANVDATIAARLAQEARILGRLEHPGIVPVHDFGRLPDGRLFYAMKRIRGERLDRWTPGVDLHTRLAAFIRICEAVSFAHAHGVIHRDLKPENVMIGEFGELLVLDWGVARVLDRRPAPTLPVATATPAPTTAAAPGASAPTAAPAPAAATSSPAPTPVPATSTPSRAPLASMIDTAHGTIIGTPTYMAPEQSRGDVAAIDQRTDIYALGALLATLFSGSESGALEAIATKARAERPADRYQTAQELSADVSRFMTGLAVHARREPLLDRVKRVALRYRTALLLLLTYLLARLLLFWAFRV